MSQVFTYWINGAGALHHLSMKYPAILHPLWGPSHIVVNLLNHEKIRGRTSSAASCMKEDFMALSAQSPTPAGRSVPPTFMRYKNVTRAASF